MTEEEDGFPGESLVSRRGGQGAVLPGPDQEETRVPTIAGFQLLVVSMEPPVPPVDASTLQMPFAAVSA